MKLLRCILSAIPLNVCSALVASAAVETYTIDPVHSSAGFTIRHFVSKVPGKFGKLIGTIRVDRENLAQSVVEATIEVASIDTGNQKRDKRFSLSWRRAPG